MSRRATLGLWAAALLLAGGACDCGETPRTAGRRPGDRFNLDAGDRWRLDGGADGGATDAADGGDGGPRTDASADGGGPRDGGSDAGGDAAIQDGGSVDTGSPSDSGLNADSGAFDAGLIDSGTVDSGVPVDSGVGSGDLWLEIDYAGAGSPQSPGWSFSNTPGWSASDWAFTGGGCCAEAWDRFNNMSVVNDPIGRSLEIGPGSQLQLMFGIVRLTSFTGVTVELEGRSRATSSQVVFEVTNPANGCGVGNLTMSQDWTPDIVLVDLTPCLQTGSALQAIRVDPTGGSSTIALLRMRLTIHGAQF